MKYAVKTSEGRDLNSVRYRGLTNPTRPLCCTADYTFHRLFLSLNNRAAAVRLTDLENLLIATLIPYSCGYSCLKACMCVMV